VVDGIIVPKIITDIQNLDNDAVLTYVNCRVLDGRIYFNNDVSLEATVSLESKIYGNVILNLIKTNILEININKML
jgi:hypothetical protein